MCTVEKAWDRTIYGEYWSINIHITKAQFKKVENFRYVIPYRIGIDFDEIKEGIHNFIPNFTPSDVVRLIELLEFLEDEARREAIKSLSWEIGIELDFRRRMKLNISKGRPSDYEGIEIYYEDPHRGISMQYFGEIGTRRLSEFIKALKEALLEYIHLINQWLVLGKVVSIR